MADPTIKGSSASFSTLGLREVVPDQSGNEQWKELLLYTDGTHLTLQDIKLPESCTAGGFCYRDSSSVLTRNRFITWQICNDILELVEQSLDLNLHGNCLRIRFHGLAILDGTSIHETENCVIILVSTISSVHRLVLPHPSKHNEPTTLGTNTASVPSIFTEASTSWLRESASYQVVNTTAANVSLPYTAASCLDEDNHEALFALANSSSVTLIKMGHSAASITTSILKPSTYVSRLLSGIIPNVLKGNTVQENEDSTASIKLVSVGGDVLVLALSKGLKLRIWSSATQECRLVHDLLDYFGDKSVKQLGSLHRIQLCCDGSDLRLAIFSSFGKNRMFLLLNLKSGPMMQVHCLCSITAQHSHLIDYALTSTHLYALWSTNQGEFQLEFMPVPVDMTSTQNQPWQTVSLEPSVDSDVEFDELVTDPKQAYMKAIFKPGVFSAKTLSKALQAFERSNGGSRRTSNLQSTVSQIKEEIVASIESVLQAQLWDMEFTEECVQLSHKCWAQFYTYVVQYHQKRPIPVGLLIDETTGFHCLLKKGMISFLRPLDLVESLVLQRGRPWSKFSYSGASHIFSQQPVSSGLTALLEVLSLVNDELSMEQINRFDQLMFQLQSADQIAKDIANELIQSDPLSLLDCINAELASIDFCLALSALLQQLSVGMTNTRNDQRNKIPEVPPKSSFHMLFNGAMGLSALVESARQMADLRLALCRNVLIVQQLLILSQKKLQLSPVDAETIRSEFLPRTVPLTHAYYALSWLCHYSAQTMSNSLIEQNIRQMAVLGFKKPQDTSMLSSCKTLVELFITLDGGQAARGIVLKEEDMEEWTSPWIDAFPRFVKAIGQLLWPIGNHTTFMEFLMERFQPSAIQGYVRLLLNWCDWNTCSRKFLMAVALVSTGEGAKASRWMLEAAEGIEKEDLLLSIILRNSNEMCEADLYLRYYLVCVQFLEQSGLCHTALRVATVALNSGRNNDPLLPTMWSIVAKLHLQLAHYQEAYEAIISNPDGSQRPESLGRLVNTLLERKRMDILLTFPYAGLESELEKIVERRARSSDVLSMKLYYSFLYSFHVRQGKMRKAAAVMYEQALRYGYEGDSPKRVKCLLACLNSLRLVSKDEAWLVKPVSLSGSLSGNASGPRTVDVIEYADIEKEYELSYACLNLGQSISSLSHPDVVALLTSRNRYESALRISRIFQVEDTSSIIEHLAGKCVLLSRETSEEDDAWGWLAENQASGVGKASVQAWRLLERLLPKAENGEKQTRCHRAAARRILDLNCTLPYWLAASFKLRNPAELISVYHQAGLLEEAAQVAIELVDAMVGKGKACYGLTNPLQPNSPPVWLPYTVIDRLVMELKCNVQDSTYEKLLNDVQEKMETYFGLAERVSRSTIEMS